MAAAAATTAAANFHLRAVCPPAVCPPSTHHRMPSRRRGPVAVRCRATFRPIPENIDPLSCSDQESISRLGRYRSTTAPLEGDWLDLAAVHPEELPSWFIMRQESAGMEGWKMDHGDWLARNIVSISGNMSQSNSPDSPKFVGTKSTLEFEPMGSTKAVYGMTRYNLLTTREDGDGLDLDDELSLCHVYPPERKGKVRPIRNGKRPRPGYAPDPPKGITLAQLDELHQMMSKTDPTEYPHLDSVDSPDLLKRPRSGHWDNFVKIHTKTKIMYAACNHCDTMLTLTAGTSCGTGSLKRHHNESCRCKPKREMLPGSSVSTPTSSIASGSVREVEAA